MSFKEIIERLIARDNAVVSCFFFWEGPTLEHINEVRRKDPIRAASMKRPVCNTCRPLLLRTLSELYENKPFDYISKVDQFYLYLIEKNTNGVCPLETIKNPDTLMGWISSTAYFFFLNEKKKEDKRSRAINETSLDDLCKDPASAINDIVAEAERAQIIDYVESVIKAMPNRKYAAIIDEIVLELAQYQGKEKIDKKKELIKSWKMTPGAMDVAIHHAKRLFQKTARKI